MKVVMIAAGTLCGRISPAGMGSEADRRILEKARAATGASLMGAETLRQADPEMRGPGGALDSRRLRAFITCSGRIPLHGKKIFAAGPAPLVFTSAKDQSKLADQLEGNATVLALPPGPMGLSVRAAVGELGRLGATSVLIEGGGRLNYAALKEGVVDEIFLTLTPKLSGDENAASLADGPGPLAGPFLPLRLVSCESCATGELFLQYKVRKKEL